MLPAPPRRACGLPTLGGRHVAMYDTIIIGAGLSGLAAGVRLAHYDRRVCILERHSTIGGLNSFYRQGGRSFDVGLHAITNFTPQGAKRGPLARLLRQLRFRWEDLGLVPQLGSRIAFPGLSLRFTNDFEFLRSQIHDHFPDQRSGLARLLERIHDYEELDFDHASLSARGVVSECLTDPLLIEMLLCPLMWYGSAREDDMDFAQFSIMFRSMYLEGLGRPLAGIRLILKQLVRKFKALGGELRLRAGVDRIHVDNRRAVGVVLDDGSELTAHHVISSAGWVETMRMCDDVSQVDEQAAGQLSFVESISVLDRQPQALGHSDTIVFYNDSPAFHWRRPDALVDPRTGVVCSPNNFQYDEPAGEGQLRITALADFARWQALPPDEYRLAKLTWYDRVAESAVRFVPDFRRAVIDVDMFTPTTIRRFTGHVNGAVYGAPRKHYDGRTHLENVCICGTDQGFVGVIGAITSGIAMANRHLTQAG